MPVKEIQLKSIKGNISKISSWNNYHFSLIKVHRNENKLTEFKMGNVYIFSQFGRCKYENECSGNCDACKTLALHLKIVCW